MVEREEEMTDNRTTELCRLLEERGIEWKDGDAAYEIEWNTPDGRHCSAMYWKPTLTVLISGCTPEQAIAATLVNERGTCHAESDLSEWVCSNCQCWIPLGLTPENIKNASEWRYCPHCGARVVACGAKVVDA